MKKIFLILLAITLITPVYEDKLLKNGFLNKVSWILIIAFLMSVLLNFFFLLRIKEELKMGKKIQDAILNGFERHTSLTSFLRFIIFS